MCKQRFNQWLSFAGVDPALYVYSRRLGKAAFWEKEDSYIWYLFDGSFKELIVPKIQHKNIPWVRCTLGWNIDAMKGKSSFPYLDCFVFVITVR